MSWFNIEFSQNKEGPIDSPATDTGLWYNDPGTYAPSLLRLLVMGRVFWATKVLEYMYFWQAACQGQQL
jgi:hypothetical protein